MDNVYTTIRDRPNTKKFFCSDSLLAKLTCAEHNKEIDLWSPVDHIVYVIKGKKAWHSNGGVVSANAGQAVYLKKGARMVEQFFDEDFCFMIFFMTDDFIREVVKGLEEHGISVTGRRSAKFSEKKIQSDTALTACFHSMDEYFAAQSKPHESLIRIKVKELVTSLLVSDKNKGLSNSLQSVAHSKSPHLKETMERNFRKNLTVDEFSAMCHRSVSTFKRDFREAYNATPARWIVARRLEYSVALLRGTEKSISEIVLECGFVDISHYSKSFKSKFGVSPSVFRKQLAA